MNIIIVIIRKTQRVLVHQIGQLFHGKTIKLARCSRLTVSRELLESMAKSGTPDRDKHFSVLLVSGTRVST